LAFGVFGVPERRWPATPASQQSNREAPTYELDKK
jgi:hypothetical protein